MYSSFLNILGGEYEKYTSHAEKLVENFEQKRAIILSKRRKLGSNTEEEQMKKVDNYNRGLKYISDNLIPALETYEEVFNKSLPEISSLTVKNKFPEDLDITFAIKNHTLRFLSRMTNRGEEFQRVLVDGMLYAESAYQGVNRKMEIQVGLWSDIGVDAWGIKSDEDEFLYFFKVLLPELMETFWNNATLALVHSSKENLSL